MSICREGSTTSCVLEEFLLSPPSSPYHHHHTIITIPSAPYNHYHTIITIQSSPYHRLLNQRATPTLYHTVRPSNKRTIDLPQHEAQPPLAGSRSAVPGAVSLSLSRRVLSGSGRDEGLCDVCLYWVSRCGLLMVFRLEKGERRVLGGRWRRRRTRMGKGKGTRRMGEGRGGGYWERGHDTCVNVEVCGKVR